MMETDCSRAQTPHLETQYPACHSLIGHKLAKCLAPVQLTVTRRVACVTRCVVPGVTSAQAPLMHAHKSKGQSNTVMASSQDQTGGKNRELMGRQTEC